MADTQFSAVYEDTGEQEVSDGVQEQEEQGAQEPAKTEKEEVISPAKQRAIAEKWTDYDTWVASGKDPDEWVDYKEFNFRGDLMKTITKLNQTIKHNNETFSKTLEEQVKLSNKQIEAARKKERAEAEKQLKALRRQALDEGDYVKMEAYEDELQALRETKIAPPDKEEPKEPDIYVAKTGKPKDFWDSMDKHIEDVYLSKNSWYKEDVDMKDSFDTYFAQELNNMIANTPGYDESDVEQALVRADSRIRRVFSHKFNADKPQTVEGGRTSKATKPAAKKHKFTEKDLNEFQLAIGKSYVKQGGMTMQEFVDSLAEMGELS